MGYMLLLLAWRLRHAGVDLMLFLGLVRPTKRWRWGKWVVFFGGSGRINATMRLGRTAVAQDSAPHVVAWSTVY